MQGHGCITYDFCSAILPYPAPFFKLDCPLAALIFQILHSTFNFFPVSSLIVFLRPSPSPLNNTYSQSIAAYCIPKDLQFSSQFRSVLPVRTHISYHLLVYIFIGLFFFPADFHYSSVAFYLKSINVPLVY